MKVKVTNLTSPRSGRPVANQYDILISRDDGVPVEKFFQSYDSVIAHINYGDFNTEASVTLDKQYWDYSRTTGKYRNQWLGESKAETERNIRSGEYKLANLN